MTSLGCSLINLMTALEKFRTRARVLVGRYYRSVGLASLRKASRVGSHVRIEQLVARYYCARSLICTCNARVPHLTCGDMVRLPCCG